MLSIPYFGTFVIRNSFILRRRGSQDISLQPHEQTDIFRLVLQLFIIVFQVAFVEPPQYPSIKLLQLFASVPFNHPFQAAEYA